MNQSTADDMKLVDIPFRPAPRVLPQAIGETIDTKDATSSVEDQRKRRDSEDTEQEKEVKRLKLPRVDKVLAENAKLRAAAETDKKRIRELEMLLVQKEERIKELEGEQGK